MADLSKKYEEILEDIENKLKNPQDLEFVKGKISELTLLFMNTIDKLLETMEEHQSRLERKVEKMEKSIEQIEDDMYIDDEDDEDDHDNDVDKICSYNCECNHDNDDYEFEIVCPYCGHEFVTDDSFKDEDEIECPKCHNIIELDWDDSECSGKCGSCGSHCYNDSDDEIKIPSVAEDEKDYRFFQEKNKNEGKIESENINSKNQNSNLQNKKASSNSEIDHNKNSRLNEKNDDQKGNQLKKQENIKKDNNEDDM